MFLKIEGRAPPAPPKSDVGGSRPQWLFVKVLIRRNNTKPIKEREYE